MNTDKVLLFTFTFNYLHSAIMKTNLRERLTLSSERIKDSSLFFSWCWNFFYWTALLTCVSQLGN